jgi:hypothetical protein
MAQMRQDVMALQATGGEVRLPYYLALIAEACGQAGQTETGLALLAEALTQAKKSGNTGGKRSCIDSRESCSYGAGRPRRTPDDCGYHGYRECWGARLGGRESRIWQGDSVFCGVFSIGTQKSGRESSFRHSSRGEGTNLLLSDLGCSG